MYILRIEKDGRSKNVLYKTEKGARKALERIEKNDENVKCILFEQVGTRFKQEQLPF